MRIAALLLGFKSFFCRGSCHGKASRRACSESEKTQNQRPEGSQTTPQTVPRCCQLTAKTGTREILSIPNRFVCRIQLQWKLSAPTVPDSDDAFMFYGLATQKVRSSLVAFRHVLSDIETLNRKAMEGVYDLSGDLLSRLSVRCRQICADGQRIERGRRLRSYDRGRTRPMEPEEIKGKKIAIPGTLTTAYLALKIFEPDFEPVMVPFDRILETVQTGAADAGLIIHEAQLTYNEAGLSSRDGYGQVVEG